MSYFVGAADRVDALNKERNAAVDMDYLRHQTIPITELERAEVRALVQECSIVWAFDRHLDQFSLFHGKEMLEDIARGGPHATEFDPQETIVFEIDSSTEELEFLVAAVTVLKGSHCYGA